MATKELLKDEQLANILGIHRVTVRKLALSGKIPSFKIGRARRYDIDAVLAAMACGCKK